MSSRRLVAAAVVALSLAGPCFVAAQPVATAPGVAPTSRRFGGVREDHILNQLVTARILRRRQVGSTSVNLYLHLDGDVDAAFKPRTQTHPENYRGEIAAFRIGRLLSLDRVPPAISRAFPASALHLSAQTLVTIERDSTVRGAMIYWVPALRDSRIDQERERRRWASWLRQGDRLEPDSATRAEEISTLIVFDALIGNWDRWSGQNVPMDASGHLVYRDHNEAFSEPFGERMLQGVMRNLRQVQRFSRSVITRVRGLSDASIRAEMSLDPDSVHPPLTNVQIASVLHRRDALVAYVNELVHRYGETSVYAFP